MSASGMSFRYLTRARIEFPWATTSTPREGVQVGGDGVVPVGHHAGHHVGQALGVGQDPGGRAR